MAAKETYDFKKRDVFPALFWITIGLGVMTVSYQMSLGTLHAPGPGLLPFILGTLLLIVSLPILINSLAVSPEELGDPEGIWSGIDFKNVLITVGSLVAYSLLLEKIGFFIAAFLFLFVLFSLFDSRRWIFALAVSFITVSATYALFALILQVELPPAF